MLNRRKFGLMAVASAVVSGCSSKPKFLRYDGPEVTSIVVNKGERHLYLLHNETILKRYKFDLGFAPVGDKKQRGDGRTPEGNYLIDRKNPRSSFHLSLGISYPDSKDRAAARALGVDPGGDIFIHGQPNLTRAKGDDWTAGCIAVKNREIEEIYSMVNIGTLITLRA